MSRRAFRKQATLFPQARETEATEINQTIQSFALAMLGKGKPDNSVPEPLELHYPFWYAWRAFIRWYRSDFVALPNAGGLDDQDDDLLDDLYAILAHVDYAMRRGRKKRRSSDDKPAPSLPTIADF